MLTVETRRDRDTSRYIEFSHNCRVVLTISVFAEVHRRKALIMDFSSRVVFHEHRFRFRG